MSTVLALPPSTQHRFVCPVEDRHTVPRVLPDTLLATGAPVLASATLLALCEHACWQLLRPHLSDGEVTLGCGFGLRHCGPAWPGEELVITTVVTDADPRRGAVDFRCTAHVDQRLVGELEHHARVVDQQRWVAATRSHAAATIT